LQASVESHSYNSLSNQVDSQTLLLNSIFSSELQQLLIQKQLVVQMAPPAGSIIRQAIDAAVHQLLLLLSMLLAANAISGCQHIWQLQQWQQQ